MRHRTRTPSGACQSFGRVPVLDHDGFRLCETAAITRYLDEAFPGPKLQPTTAAARARMTQVIGIADAYAYWPLVRQVYAQAMFRPALGEAPDEAVIAKGMAAAPRILSARDAIAAEGLALQPDAPPDLAVLHLAPMLAAFAHAPGVAALIAAAPHLSAWWQSIAQRPGFTKSDPGLPDT